MSYNNKSPNLLLLFSLLFVLLLFVTATTFSAAAASSSSTCPSGETVDPYSGLCLSTIDEDSLLMPCDEATSIAKCGCSTCALPGCDGCISSSSSSSGKSSSSSTCSEGWTTEYKDFPCKSIDGSSSSIIASNSKDRDMLMSSGVIFGSPSFSTSTSTPSSSVLVNSEKLIRQMQKSSSSKTTISDDFFILFGSSSSSSTTDQKIVVALNWLPPIFVTILSLFVFYFLVSRS